jgi:hypothetical protein
MRLVIDIRGDGGMVMLLQLLIVVMLEVPTSFSGTIHAE